MTAIEMLPPFSPRMFLVPALASAVMLGKLWWDGALFGRRAAIFIFWFVAAAVMQFASSGLAWWLAGLVAQTALAIVLAVRIRLDDPLR